MTDSHAAPMRRRRVLSGLAALGGFVATVASLQRVSAQSEQMTVAGGGVNVKQMPAAEGDGTVPLRESFSFDAHYAQCIVEDNSAAFAMDTHDMGRVVNPEHAFFMAMYSTQMGLVSIKRTNVAHPDWRLPPLA